MKQLDTQSVVPQLKKELQSAGFKPSFVYNKDSINIQVVDEPVRNLNLIKKMSEKYIRSLSTDSTTPKTEYLTVRNFKRPR